MANDTTFPEVVDSTIMKAAKSCYRKFYWEFYRNKVATGLNPDLNAGAAWARGHEVFRKCYYGKDYSFEDALVEGFIHLTIEYGDETNDPPHDNPKQWDRMVEAFIAYYYEAYPPHFDDIAPVVVNEKPAVEYSFALPIEDVLHPETGQPILYGGTFDMLAEKASMLRYVFDDKTTKQMGGKWAEQWRLRSQFIGYTWAARQHYEGVQGAWVRGCALKKTQIEFADAPVAIPNWMVSDWHDAMVRELRLLIEAWKENRFPKNYDEACSQYGGCQFLDICEMPDSQAESFIKSSYEDRTWNPIATESY